MFRAFKLCQIFGIDIIVELPFFMMLGLITWMFSSKMNWALASAVSLIFAFSILFHEMAHSLTAKKFGIRVERITFVIFGVMAQLHPGDIRAMLAVPKIEFFVALAGPLSSIALGGIFYGLAIITPKPFDLVFDYLFVINVTLAVFNMLPAFPLDGSRVFRSVLRWPTKSLLTATKITVVASIIIIILLPIAMYFLGGLFNAIWIWLIGFFILVPGAIAEYQLAKEVENWKKTN